MRFTQWIFLSLSTLATLVLANPCRPDLLPGFSAAERALCTEVSLVQDIGPLSEWLSKLSKKVGVPIIPDDASLDFAGATLDAPVTVNDEKLPLHLLLPRVLDDKYIDYRVSPNAIWLVGKGEDDQLTTEVYRYDPKKLKCESIPHLLKGLRTQLGMINEEQFAISPTQAFFALRAPSSMHWLMRTEPGVRRLLPSPDPAEKAARLLDLPLRQNLIFQAVPAERAIQQLANALAKQGAPSFRYHFDFIALNDEGIMDENTPLNAEIPFYPKSSGMTVREILAAALPREVVYWEQDGTLVISSKTKQAELKLRRDYSAPPQVSIADLFALFRNTVAPASWESEAALAEGDVLAEIETLKKTLEARIQELAKEREKPNKVDLEQLTKKMNKELEEFSKLQAGVQQASAKVLQLQLQSLLHSTLSSREAGMGTGQLIQKNSSNPEFTVVNTPDALDEIDRLMRLSWRDIGAF